MKDSKRIDIVVLGEEIRLPKVDLEIKIYNGSLNLFGEDVRMRTKLAKWASDHDQISKSGLSPGSRISLLSSMEGIIYNWLRIEGYMENVRLSFPVFADNSNKNGLINHLSWHHR